MQNVIIIGAAGRDFHDFNAYWRQRGDCRVVAFTAAQIPDIAGRVYPPILAGPRYPDGISIHAESELAELIARHSVDLAAMAYSDLPHQEVMHKAALVNAAGADFIMLGHKATMLSSSKPVIAVCAVRTGCGKSQTSRAVVRILKELGLKVAAVRHPMPYGDLSKQICQRFATLEDMDRHECTIEEREEYEPHVAAGNVIFAGVDYAKILAAAEAEADVILWDGGNNDLPFFRPNLHITVADPHRPGHESRYYPGETNVRMADVVVINKCDTAHPADIAAVRDNITNLNPRAEVMLVASPVTASQPELIRGKRVIVIEDGPTLTHGEMRYGAGHIAAEQFGAARIVDPRPYAVGSIKGTFAKYGHLSDVLPAMGYGGRQIGELEQTINAAEADVVLIGTPIDLGRILKINKPAVRIGYELREQKPGGLRAAIESILPNR
ncbi:Cyclic 2,3-diphosphoglycerate synthetase [Phycisphaerae bacterium RAS1]|nr:Cyclic 2,3-diphosphoglycerate synthetase [Phycisphaerae bacterium RAS1]